VGGYFLNCVTNYYLQKRFPDIEFYFEPIANDAGTAIGAAKLLWHDLTQDTTIRPFKSLYLGKQYSKKKLLKGIKKYT
jgi:carbamoyltransferase